METGYAVLSPGHQAELALSWRLFPNWLIDERYHTRKGLSLHEFECSSRAFFKEALAFAHHHGVHQQTIAIHEVMLDECLHKHPTAIDQNILTVLLL